MTVDQPLPQTGQNGPLATAASVKKVSDCRLGLTWVRLRFLICTTADGSSEMPHQAGVDIKGELVQSSLTPSGFAALITWSVRFLDVSMPPVSISGQHELAFSGEGINDNTASYYAQVNSVILAYPYVRQVIDDLTMRTLGRGILIPPLDVPARVAQYRASLGNSGDAPAKTK